MIRLYDLNACEWRTFAEPAAVPPGRYQTDAGEPWDRDAAIAQHQHEPAVQFQPSSKRARKAR